MFSRRPHNRRKRADRTQILVDVFAAQLESMTDTYMSWNLVMAEKSLGAKYTQPRDSVLQEKRQVLVVDLYGAYFLGLGWNELRSSRDALQRGAHCKWRRVHHIGVRAAGPHALDPSPCKRCYHSARS
jgi:hypothetical protein